MSRIADFRKRWQASLSSPAEAVACWNDLLAYAEELSGHLARQMNLACEVTCAPQDMVDPRNCGKFHTAACWELRAALSSGDGVERT